MQEDKVSSKTNPRLKETCNFPWQSPQINQDIPPKKTFSWIPQEN